MTRGLFTFSVTSSGILSLIPQLNFWNSHFLNIPLTYPYPSLLQSSRFLDNLCFSNLDLYLKTVQIQLPQLPPLHSSGFFVPIRSFCPGFFLFCRRARAREKVVSSDSNSEWWEQGNPLGWSELGRLLFKTWEENNELLTKTAALSHLIK